MATADMTTATSLVSAGTKSVLDKAKKETRMLSSPDEAFQLSTFQETLNGNKAEVKNDVLSIPMVKEGDGWKVVLNEELLNNIQQRDELLSTVKTKWEALQTAYENRLKVAKAYVDYKKGIGPLSPQAQALEKMITSISTSKASTKEELLAYVQKQQQLNKIIDAALEPSLAANTDLSLQYILQMSTAADRIKAAEAAYQPAAQKARSTLYVPLPFQTKSDVKVNNS
jgi:hypothetical protein